MKQLTQHKFKLYKISYYTKHYNVINVQLRDSQIYIYREINKATNDDINKEHIITIVCWDQMNGCIRY